MLIDKNDLDKVDPHRRRPVTLPQGPKVFVFDTIVFVDCPDILSRIKAPDSAVIPSTVLG